MERDRVHLRITIGPKPTVLRVILVSFLTFSSVLIVPIVNYNFLGGGWALDFVGGFLGLVFFIAALASLDKSKTQTFTSREEAAKWVRMWTP